MRPSHVAEVLSRIIPTGQPLYLWGPPGVGKSSLVRAATERLNMQLLDVRAVLLDPVDLRGVPRIDGDRAHWCPPSFLPREGRGVLFLDELAQAPPAVQAACLQLTLDRRIGEYVLPDGWSIVAASNRQEDRAGSQRLITPLLNRFVHLDLEVSQDDWQRWAVESCIAPEVRAFIAFRPNLLFRFEARSAERSFPTPRSWEFASRILPHCTDELAHPMISGCVGEGAAAEFVGFLRVYRGLPDIDQVLAAAATCTLPTEPSVLYALVGALAERARGAVRATLQTLYTLAGRLPAEYGVLLVRDIVAANKASLALPEAGRWLASHRDLLLGEGE